jgi:tetratricopeptide (TPR) repeat protein
MAQKDEITVGCYALLLILADAVVQTLPDQSDSDRYQEALRILDRARLLGPICRSYHLRRADYLAGLGEFRAAQEERELGSAQDPKSALDYFLIGYDLYNRGEWKAAREALDRTLGLQPKHFWATYYLALVYLQCRNWEAAAFCLTTCVGRQPGFLWPYLLRGYAHQQLKQFEAAEADFGKVLELDPPADARFCLHVNRGLLRFSQGQADQAVADLRQAIALNPVQYHAHVSLARLYQKQRQFDLALAEFDRALELGPPAVILADCHAERGRTLYLAKQYEAAVRACDTALSIRPDQAVVYGFRGLALLELKRYEPAAGAFGEYLARRGPAVADIYQGRGLARFKLHDYLGARDDYTRALELRKDWDLYHHRGWAYFFTDAWKPALSDFDEAIRLNPKDSGPFLGRGLALVMLGRHDQAVRAAADALRRKPDTPEMMHNVACIFAQAAGQVEKNVRQPENPSLASHYREQALAAIRKTLALLPAQERRAFWRDKIFADAALDPIRDCAGFRQFTEEYADARPAR